MAHNTKEPVKFFVEVYRRDDMKKVCAYTDTEHVYVHYNEVGKDVHIIEVACPMSHFMMAMDEDVVFKDKIHKDDKRIDLSLLAVCYKKVDGQMYEYAIEVDRMQMFSGDFMVSGEDGYMVRTLFHFDENIGELKNMQIHKYKV